MNYTYILMILAVVTIMLIITITWIYSRPPKQNNTTSQVTSNIAVINNIMADDSYLQRLLMIEIINDSGELSELITFNKISEGVELIYRSLIGSFGKSITQKVSILMHRRNELLKEYYKLIKGDSNSSNTTIQRKLEEVARNISDAISSLFQGHEVSNTSNTKRPFNHQQRLYNLITMYDSELLNQAKNYADKKYDISMNCSRSSLEVGHYISEELGLLMKENLSMIKTR